MKEVFKLAKEMQPSIIYIDHAELFFLGSGGAKKGKKGAKKKGKKKSSSEVVSEMTPEKLEQKRLGEMAGTLTDSLVLEMKSLAPADKVAVIAETAIPWGMSLIHSLRPLTPIHTQSCIVSLSISL